MTIGIDIGGSHITTALVDTNGNIIPQSVKKDNIRTNVSVTNFLAILSDSIKKTLAQNTGYINGIAFAMPGPFLYSKGVCALHGLNKFESLFGLDINACCSYLFSDLFETNHQNTHFINDAHAFTLGAIARQKEKDKSIIGITLGTGIGSAFYKNGTIVENGQNVPPNGYLYNTPFKNGIAEDYISTRWFLENYHAENVAAIATAANNGDEKAKSLFNEFGDNLANVLLPWTKKMQTSKLIIGGGLTNAWPLISGQFKRILDNASCSVDIELISDTQITNILGAAYSMKQNTKTIMHIRKTEQDILPAIKNEHKHNSYDIYPAHSVNNGNISQQLNDLIAQLPQGKNIIIDGYGGVYWDWFMKAFRSALKEKQIAATFYCVDAALKDPSVIDKMITPFLNSDGEQSIFGKCYDGTIHDFFDSEKLDSIQPSGEGINILYGCGAALSKWDGTLIYVDIPKNEIQFRSRGKSFINLGADSVIDAKAQYKRCYFIDWIVLNKQKQNLLPNIDFIIDGQQTDFYPFTTGHTFRQTLKRLSQQPFRPRPWFEPGIWGGQWLKEKIPSLPKNVPNYAWSFELISPENGLLLEDNRLLLEVSFDWLMYAHAKEILGKGYAAHGVYFPIRFDYLDTVDGDNLSVQCHPSLNYIKENFGESITQDETYYILDCKEDAKVYLGFQEDINANEFKNTLVQSQQTATEIDIEKYVQKLDAQKHDLFLIPNQTIHGSGKNNMVLEISNTPYIFTFKLYDWVRLDMDGKPRPINIEHGMKNLNFLRKGKLVQEELISKPVLLEETENCSHWNLPTHKEHIYAIERYEWTETINIATNDQCHLLMLVEGSSIKITANDETTEYIYAETIVVPAAVKNYTVSYLGQGRGKLLKAFLKD